MKRIKALSKETSELYSSLLRSLFLCFVAFFTIVTATVAWFVSNSHVDSNVASVSAGFEPVKLAVLSSDARQTPEQDFLRLNEGTEYRYEDKLYYYTNNDTIALRLDRDDYEVYPGAKGKIEFYIIPNEKNELVTLKIELVAYGKDINNEVNIINNDALTTLMKGHILFFDDYENGTYLNWLGSDEIFSNEITIDLAGKEPEKPVKVDIYWVWPLRYTNMESYLAGYKFLDNQASYDNMKDLKNGYRYSYVYLTNVSLENSTARSDAYDFADEYIGSNAQYLYLAIQSVR